jgi:hypothetical protein
MNNLGKLVSVLTLAASLTALSPDRGNELNPPFTHPIPEIELSDKKKNEGIEKPKGEANLVLDILVKKGKIPNLDLGDVEIRDNSLYGTLFFGYYQLLFQQVNDSTFVEHHYIRNKVDSLSRYEIFTTKRRLDSLNNPYFVLEKYETKLGKARAEKISLEGKTYNNGNMPAIIALNNFFEEKMGASARILVLGVPYDFNIHKELGEKTKNKQEIIYYAKMSDVTKTKDDVFIMDEFLNLYTEKNTIITPNKIITNTQYNKLEAQCEVLEHDKSFWIDKYKITGIVRKK